MRDREDQNNDVSVEFEKLIETYTGVINKVCFMFAGSRHDYDVLRQDVIVNLWKGMVRFRGDCGLSTWVYRIALNTCISYQKQSSIWSRRHASLDSLKELADSYDGSTDTSVRVHELLDNLNKLDKSLMLLRLDDYSYDEIAEITGMNRNAVATRLHRAKEKLRKSLNTER